MSISLTKPTLAVNIFCGVWRVPVEMQNYFGELYCL
jgi:hypothetical protein